MEPERPVKRTPSCGTAAKSERRQYQTPMKPPQESNTQRAAVDHQRLVRLGLDRGIERDLASARGLMLEAADSVHASLAETDISDSRREYREGLERRLRSLANADVLAPAGEKTQPKP